MKQYRIKPSITDRSSISVDNYLKDISRYKLLTEEEERELVKRIKNGDEEARNKLITSNLRFIISISKQYQGKGIELSDLISAGNEGLIRSISKYSLDYNCRFLSYAVWWIRDAILKEILEHGKSIKIPTEKLSKMNKLNRLIFEFEQENFRIPSLKELSQLANLEEEEIKETISLCNINIIPDTTINSDGDVESIFESLYLDEGNIDQMIKNQSASISILDFLKTNLNKTEYEVITKCFGLEGPELSLDVIGEQLNITKERVRQIKDKAIIKLRKCDGLSLLTNFL